MRRDGIPSVGVAELMNEAGLTHGGFYRHFESRDDLVAEAVHTALARGFEPVRAAAKRGGPEAVAAIIDMYLSRRHRDRPETGCAVAALPTDIARTDRCFCFRFGCSSHAEDFLNTESLFNEQSRYIQQ